MIYSSQSIERAVDHLSSLPSVGKKTALRLAFFLLRQPKEFVDSFAQSLVDLKDKIKYCSVCFNFTETDPCPICTSERRNKRVICVVEEPSDVFAIEKTNEFFGQYHVLHGSISPLDNVTAEDIKIKELIARAVEIDEVILSLNTNIEGEVTTQYIAKLLKPLGIKTTRIARGIPNGVDIEFTDEGTISRALEGRTLL